VDRTNALIGAAVLRTRSGAFALDGEAAYDTLLRDVLGKPA
jgi:hypothetical protein